MNCKIKVKDSQHSLDVQQKLFSLGCHRLNMSGEKSTTMKMGTAAFFIVSNDRIDFTDCSDFFALCPHTEMTLEQLEELY